MSELPKLIYRVSTITIKIPIFNRNPQADSKMFADKWMNQNDYKKEQNGRTPMWTGSHTYFKSETVNRHTKTVNGAGQLDIQPQRKKINLGHISHVV